MKQMKNLPEKDSYEESVSEMLDETICTEAQKCKSTLETRKKPKREAYDRFQRRIARWLNQLPVGARILKTAVALVVAMSIGKAFGIGTIFTSSAAMWGMQPTVGESLQGAKNMLKMQLLSFIPVFAVGFIFGPNMFSIFIAVILVFKMGLKLRLTSQMSIGTVTAIFILTSPQEIFFRQAALRSAGILIGLTVAILINRFIAPPQYRTLMVRQALKLNQLLLKYFREAIEFYIGGNRPDQEYRNKINHEMKQEFAIYDRLYQRFQNELLNPWEEDKVEIDDPLDWDKSHQAEKRFFEEYKELCHGLIIRTRETWSLADQKVRRMKRWKDMESSEMDQEIIDLLICAMDRLEECNLELTNKVLGKPPQPFTDPHIWQQMDGILTRWHAQSSQSRNDLHSLVEISLLNYRLRWSIKTILNMLIMEPCEMEPLPSE